MAFVTSRPGEFNSASGDAIELNLETFSGQVLKKLDHKLIMMDTQMVRQTLVGSKAAVFPTYGDASASHHAAGDDILTGTAPETGNYLSEIAVGEHIIYADRKVQSSIFLDNLDEMLNHWQHRAAFSDRLATAVAEKVEDKLFRVVVKGSGAGASDVEGQSITEWDAGQTSVEASPTGSTTYDAIWAFAQGLDVRNISKEGRFAATTTALYYDLLRLSNTSAGVLRETVHKDFADGSVSLERPPLMGIWVANVFVMPTNGIPTTDTDYNANEWRIGASADNNYDDVTMANNYSLLGWTGDSIGTAVTASPVVDVNYIPERLGHLIVLHQSMGHGVIRPEGCMSVGAA